MNWTQKLTSRKFWAGLAGFITPLLVMFSVDESTITTVTAIITSCGTLIAYIFSEGAVDKAREENTYTISEENEDGN
jgi:hypothetical protein